MKVIVSRSGGTAGIRLTWEVRVDEQADAPDWERMLAALPWTEVDDSEPHTDGYAYRIRWAPNEVVLAEQQLTPQWRELVDRIKAVSEGM